MQRLTDTSKHFVGAIKLYQQELPNGSQFGFYTNCQNWLDTMARTRREFPRRERLPGGPACVPVKAHDPDR